jgi:hypothetical protein
MPDPPDPLFPSTLLDVAGLLGFLVLGYAADGTPLGTFQDASGAPLYLVMGNGGTIGSLAWTLVSTVPTGFAGYLMSPTTYNVITGAAAARDGSGTIVYQGVAYAVSGLWNDPGHEARAVPA